VPVDKPEGWLPAGAWTGVALTRAFAAVTQAPTRAADASLGSGFALLAEPGQAQAGDAELFGREALLSHLAADAAPALGGAGPALALGMGEAGAGKTAFAAALARRIGEASLGARVLACSVSPPGSGKPGHAALAEMIGAGDGPVVRAIGDALRGAARERPT